MYGVVRTQQFERSFRKLKKSGTLKPALMKKLEDVILSLAARKSLPASYRDHQLTGDVKRYRECHIKGDLLLVYEVRNEVLILVLIDIGSHSELFG
ncbi:type II toxin-antitoxin system YafQ family toxin [bacterium]|nr:type II toxin-antitoxin system YafQ family toxin [bacterium]